MFGQAQPTTDTDTTTQINTQTSSSGYLVLPSNNPPSQEHKNKDPKDWLKQDTREWIIKFKQSLELGDTYDQEFSKFYIYPGSILVTLSKDTFEKMSPNFGSQLYDNLQSFINNFTGLQRSYSIIKKRFSTNGHIRPDESSRIYMVPPNISSMTEKVRDGQFIMLYGSRSSGKSTNLMFLLDFYAPQYTGIYISLQKLTLESFQSSDSFFSAIGRYLESRYPSIFKDSNISKDDDSFINYFIQGDSHLKKFIIVVDEFDLVYLNCNTVTTTAILSRFRFIRESGRHRVQSTIVAGPFNILSLSSANGSPFNTREVISSPLFTKGEVVKLFEEFQTNSSVILDKEIIYDIYSRTNGHPGLVCLHGKVIDESLKVGQNLSVRDWFSNIDLMIGQMKQYQTTKRILQFLHENTDKERSIEILMVLLYSKEISPTDGYYTNILNSFVSEGLAKVVNNIYSLKNPSITQLILSDLPNLDPNHQIPSSPFFVPGHRISIPHVIEKSVGIISSQSLKKASQSSFKDYKGIHVPCEAVYHTFLYSIISKWGSPLIILSTNTNGILPDSVKRCDLVIKTLNRDWTVCIELVAHTNDSVVKEHITRNSKFYQPILNANESWVINFTLDKNIDIKSSYPNVKVIHVVYETDFSSFSLKIQ